MNVPLDVDLFALTEPADPDRFLLHPVVHAYSSLRAFGAPTPHLDAVIGEIREGTPAGARVLCAGHGSAAHALRLAAALPDREIEATLATAAAAGRLTAELSRRGLDHVSVRVVDLDELSLDAGDYDAITAVGSISYVVELERFWAECRRALRPGGLVLTQGFVAPDRLEWSDAQIDAATDALSRIPAELRGHHGSIAADTFADVLEAEPRYCTRSTEILPTCLAAGLRVPRQAGAGCGLLRPVLMRQIDHFSPTDWSHNLVLAELCRREGELVAEGRLGDDFLMFVAEA